MLCPECQTEIDAPISQNEAVYWICDRCGHCTELPAVDPVERLAEFEQQYGLKLPDSYSELILPTGEAVEVNKSVIVQPSGNARIDRFLSGRNRLSVGRIFGVAGLELDTIFCTEYMTLEWGLPEDLVLLEGDGHCWLALDYRSQSHDPPVIFIESAECSWLTVAPNLAALIR